MARTELLLGSPPLRDVERRADRADDRAVWSVQRLDVDEEAAPSPVVLVHRGLASQRSYVRRQGQGSRIVSPDGVRELSMQERGRRRAQLGKALPGGRGHPQLSVGGPQDR